MNINVKIAKDKDSDKWRVRDLNEKNMGTLRAQKKDKIQWKAQGSDMSFTFIQPVDKYFEYEEGLFEDDCARVKKNDHLKVTIKEDAPDDSLTYVVWVEEGGAFAVGNSHPKIIIR